MRRNTWAKISFAEFPKKIKADPVGRWLTSGKNNSAIVGLFATPRVASVSRFALTRNNFSIGFKKEFIFRSVPIKAGL